MEIKEITRENVLVVHDGQANAPLIEKLKNIKNYLNEDLPEWQQLILLGGFVADVIKTMKWSEKPIYKNSVDDFKNWDYKEKNVMTCEAVIEEISAAINHQLSLPIADELNKMWQDWYFKDTEKYIDVKTSSDMSEIIVNRLEQEYPELTKIEEKFFYSDDSEKSKEESL